MTDLAEGYKKMAERNRAWAERAENVAKRLQEVCDEQREALERISRMGSSVEAQIARQALGHLNPERGEDPRENWRRINEQIAPERGERKPNPLYGPAQEVTRRTPEPSPAERESRRWKAERGESRTRQAYRDAGYPNPERGSSYDPERAAEWEAGEAQAEADYDAQQEKGNEV